MSSEHRLGSEDAGRTVQVAAGDRLVIALPATPGSGYTWQVEALPAGASVVEERFEEAGATGIGGSALHVLVVDPGEGGTIRLRHGQPWTPAEAAVDTYEVTVTPSA